MSDDWREIAKNAMNKVDPNRGDCVDFELKKALDSMTDPQLKEMMASEEVEELISEFNVDMEKVPKAKSDIQSAVSGWEVGFKERLIALILEE